MRNKKLINRKKTALHRDGSSALLNIALEKEGKKPDTDRQIIALFLDCVTRSGYLARDQNLPRSNFFPRLNIVVVKLRKLKISTFLQCIKRNSTYKLYITRTKTIEALPSIF